MATQAGEIEVKLTLNAGDFNKLMGQTKDKVKDFGSTASDVMGSIGKIFTFTAIAGFFTESIKAFSEEEQASAKLVNALGNQGHATQANVDHLKKMADSLRDLTAVGDEVITGAQATLVTFGLQGEELDRATRATLDLAAAQGIDLQSAAQLLGKAYQGNTTQLGRMGIQISKAIPAGKEFETVLGKIEDRMGGRAQALAATFTGQMKGLGVAFNEFQEKVGLLITGEGGGLLAWLKKIVDGLNVAMNNITRATASLGGFGNVLKVVGIELLRVVLDQATKLIDLVLEALGRFPMMGAAMESLRGHLRNVNGELHHQLDTWQATTQTAMASEAKKRDAAKKTTTALKNETKERLNVEKAMADWLKERQDLSRDEYFKDLSDRKDGYLDFVDGFLTTSEDMWKFGGEMRDQFFQQFGDGVAEAIVQGKDFGETMVNVFRQMAMAIISYIVQMIAKLLVLLALEEATGTQGVFSAGGALGGLFHMAEGGMINEPSIITGLRSGRQAIAGEAGPEAVVPMNGGGVGQPAINVYITGQFIEGNESAWQRLMRERIIPEIRRYTMVNPTGNFNRRRGAA